MVLLVGVLHGEAHAHAQKTTNHQDLMYAALRLSDVSCGQRVNERQRDDWLTDRCFSVKAEKSYPETGEEWKSWFTGENGISFPAALP